MKTILLRAVIASLILISAGKSSSAQSSQTATQSPDTELKGTLVDTSGGGVGGAQIVAQLAGDSQSHLWKATSTTSGEYSLMLPPGKYHVVFRRAPFVRREFDLDLSGGVARILDLKLELERVS